MGLRRVAARGASALSTWGLRHVFRRPAANFPGKAALLIDPHIIAGLKPLLRKGSAVVCGTNGKTTVNNLVADALEHAGSTVVCNRTGANLDSGIATALLHGKEADWGVFECDELWAAKVLPQLAPDYLLLLNLFRDQLDRVGEVSVIQDSLVAALESSPRTVLVYNADDPFCAAVAARVPNKKATFGTGRGEGDGEGDGDGGPPCHTSGGEASPAPFYQMCPMCSGMLAYASRRYEHLGEYACGLCGFGRPPLDFAAQDISLGAEGLSFEVLAEQGARTRISAAYSGEYMAYNLLAAFALARLLGCPEAAFHGALDAFDPQNGRLQRFSVEGRPVLLNLAKNPTGFNQNLSLILHDTGPVAAAFFVNDKEGDGRDPSWLWDVDFEALARRLESGEQAALPVFAGGIRREDLQTRLRYAGLEAELVDSAEDVLALLAGQSFEGQAYLIANYTALPPVREDLLRLERRDSGRDTGGGASSPRLVKAADRQARQSGTETHPSPRHTEQPPRHTEQPVRIAHLLPDLLNFYGDGGNVTCLRKHCEWRGIPVEAVSVTQGQALGLLDLADIDIVFIGGGPDREQAFASEQLLGIREKLRAFVEADGVLLAVCGGFQLLGHEQLVGGRPIPGLGLVDMVTTDAGGKAGRLVGDISLQTELSTQPVTGYENHAGRTFLGDGLRPFGRVVSSTGHGNNDTEKIDGVFYRNVLGSYLHGPLLGKNPQVTEALITRALERRGRSANPR